MSQQFSPESVQLLSAHLQKRYEPNFVWGNAIGIFTMIPRLRGFWPMSTVQAEIFPQLPDVYDFSHQALTLTNDTVTVLSLEGLCPIAKFNGASNYLWRSADNALGMFDATWNDDNGMTFGGWFKFLDDTTPQGLISKWDTALNQRSYRLHYGNGVLEFEYSWDGIGTNSANYTWTPIVNRWYFIAGRFHQDNTIDLYLDRDKVRSVAIAPVNSPFNGAANFEIGLSNGTEFLNGAATLCFICHYPLPDYYMRALWEHTRAMFGV